MTLLGILALLALFVTVWVFYSQRKIRRLRRDRLANGISRDQFIETFRKLGISDTFSTKVYDYYGSQKALKDFPFSPDDRYADILHDDPEDIDDDAVKLVSQLGMILPPERILREYPSQLRTLRDMVFWLEWIRERQPTEAPQPQKQ
jgi:hypothetical protein